MRPGRLTAIAVVATTVAASVVLGAGTAFAAVPAFPDNIIVFPDRDFVSIDGYDGHRGETATVEVYRPGVGIVGSAHGPLAGGSPSLEVNHPGGVCWGAGTGLKVTPDIQPGDTVTVKVGDEVLGDTITGAGTVAETASGPAYTLDGATLTVRGPVGGGNPAFLEQRIVNPELRNTAVGRRDVIAADPVLTPGPRGGYSSMLAVNGDEFTATYVFTTPATAGVAVEGLMTASTWQAQDVDGNQQGLTISEYGELGGPGMGGCPNGAPQTGPPAPDQVTAARSADGTSIKLTWTPATALPGTPAITGYRVAAIAATVTNGEQAELGKRLGSPAAKGTTLTGLSAAEDYVVELRSVSGAGETFPAATVQPLVPGQDVTPPTVAASPSGGSFPVPQQVTLAANEAGADVYYSLQAVDLVTGGALSTHPSVTRYTAPFTIAESTTLTYVAFDPSGNVSDQGTKTFTITDDPVPAAPAFAGAPVAGRGTVTLHWTAPDPGAPTLEVTGYAVQAYTTDGTPAGAPRTVGGDVSSLVFDGLTPDTPYLFTVRAENKNGLGPESAEAGPVTALGDLVAAAGPDRTGIVRGSLVHLDGSGSTTTGVTYRWEQVLTGAADPDKVDLADATTPTPTFTLPLYRYPMTNKGLTFELTVTDGTSTRQDRVLVVPATDQVTIATGRYKAGSELRIDGSGSVVGAVITIHAGSLGGPVIGTPVQVVSAAPAAGGTWSIRLRGNAVPATSPGRVWIESDHGGTAGPSTLG